MSGDCLPMAERTAQEPASKPMSERIYPMSLTVRLTSCSMSTHALVEISPPTRTIPVLQKVSQATRAWVSCCRIASSTASEIWSAILSGCPSETDSEVKSLDILGLSEKLESMIPHRVILRSLDGAVLVRAALRAQMKRLRRKDRRQDPREPESPACSGSCRR